MEFARLSSTWKIILFSFPVGKKKLNVLNPRERKSGISLSTSMSS